MKMNIRLFNLKKYFIIASGALFISLNAQNKKFTLVIDPGHGNQNGSARHYSDLGEVREDHVVLGVGLKLGKLLEKNKDIKVIFTRTSDVLPSLTDRTNLANRSKADLFVSIHCNSTGSGTTAAYGTETFVQGPDQNKANLEVAKRENSVIYLDKQDEQNFASYDPSSPESLIALKLQQSKYLASSLMIGGLVEENFVKKNNRNSRGVKQANLHVLRQNAMPSILIETGFVNNYDDAQYLISEKGQQEIAESIYDAILKYKKASERNNAPQISQEVPEKKEEKKLDSDYRIHIITSPNKYTENDPIFRGLNYILTIKEGNNYNYYYAVTNLESGKIANLEKVKSAGFNNAKAVAFKTNEKLKRGYYTIEVAVSDSRLRNNDKIFQVLGDVNREKIKGVFHYTYGNVNTLESAVKLQKQIEDKGINNTVIEKK
ncbi:N-acetylmuramoyl-L-alanine amidase [Elizabethkingia sp. JS20170427COW]|uniref:N-acetylmuramoyl-L-alanine amidase family protein n=1 Tax=Elizabethkingia sp. JS20170427COW TaxID=2583851 RepID=UPI001110F509|nr:N-acetylmuramoyl-L-alanine amidase [Elizabethkingia sp. JS20170427COW]QCX52942.1 N-acetylmuramoyl-L-alanine amidase [Elizabethkingia sp. JS20170427COW]